MGQYQYGLGEVDKDNWQRLLSSESKELFVLEDLTNPPLMVTPINSITLIESVVFQYHTSVLSHGYIGLLVNNPQTGIVWEVDAPYDHPVHTAIMYNFLLGTYPFVVPLIMAHAPLPLLTIKGGDALSLTANTTGAGDSWSSINIRYKQLILNSSN